MSMPKSFNHPAYFSRPDSDYVVRNEQPSPEDLERDPELAKALKNHIEGLTFDMFFKEENVALTDKHAGYLSILQSVGEQLFQQVKEHTMPGYCMPCMEAGASAVARRQIPWQFELFRLIFVAKISGNGKPDHAWAELILKGQFDGPDLAENYFSCERLVIDFNGVSPVAAGGQLGQRNISNPMHHTYTPFFGSPALAHHRLSELYLRRAGLTVVHHIERLGSRSFYALEKHVNTVSDSDIES